LNVKEPTIGTEKKKGIYGILRLGVLTARYLPQLKMHDSFQAVIKIDGNIKAKTKFSRSLKWNEKFEIEIDKGVEVEIGIYDKNSSVSSFMWFKLADIAGQVAEPAVTPTSARGSLSSENLQQEWYDLETSGQICLGISFGRLLFIYPELALTTSSYSPYISNTQGMFLIP
jgi:hypothetical protein